MPRNAAPHLRQLAHDFLWRPFCPVPTSGDDVIIVSGNHCHVTDIDGNVYIDAKSAALNASCGHGSPEIIEAITTQLRELMTFEQVNFLTAPPVLLAAKYAQLLPAPLHRTLFCGSGSEATEAALKVAWFYHSIRGKTEKRLIVGVDNGYHGITFGALSASGLTFPKIGLQFGTEYVHVATPGRGSRALDTKGWKQGAPIDLLMVIEQFGADAIAAFIIEPILGIGGVIVPPSGYLEEIRNICDAHDILLIMDEVLTGFGRTGKMFAFEHTQVVPDILTTSKGLTGGYFPLAAVTVKQSIFETFARDVGRSGLRHGHTNSGHATACQTALQTIAVIERKSLVENAARVGRLLIEKLEALVNFGFVKEVRGRGLLVGIEFSSAEVAARITRECLSRRLIVRSQQTVITLAPPLCFTESLAEQTANIIVRACESIH